MAGQVAGGDQHEIEAQAQTGEVRPSLEEGRGGAQDASALGRAQRLRPRLGTVAVLDLDEGQKIAPASHEIDLPRRTGEAPGEDPVAP